MIKDTESMLMLDSLLGCMLASCIDNLIGWLVDSCGSVANSDDDDGDDDGGDDDSDRDDDDCDDDVDDDDRHRHADDSSIQFN